MHLLWNQKLSTGIYPVYDMHEKLKIVLSQMPSSDTVNTSKLQMHYGVENNHVDGINTRAMIRKPLPWLLFSLHYLWRCCWFWYLLPLIYQLQPTHIMPSNSNKILNWIDTACKQIASNHLMLNRIVWSLYGEPFQEKFTWSTGQRFMRKMQPLDILCYQNLWTLSNESNF